MAKKWLRLIVPVVLICSAPRPLHADDISLSLLQGLVDKSDLVIVATPQEVCGGATGETVGQPGRMVEFMYMTPLLRIDRIVKSDGFAGKTVRIHFSTRRFVGDLPPPSSIQKKKFSFDEPYSFQDDGKGLPGSPTKGVAYVFFLENGKKRHPDSHFGFGTEELVYWSFDYDFGMIATTPKILAKLDRVYVDQSHK
jgi:hypothetical protein